MSTSSCDVEPSIRIQAHRCHHPYFLATVRHTRQYRARAEARSPPRTTQARQHIPDRLRLKRDHPVQIQRSVHLEVAMANYRMLLFVCLIIVVLLPAPTVAFGAGNIASISRWEFHFSRPRAKDSTDFQTESKVTIGVMATSKTCSRPLHFCEV